MDNNLKKDNGISLSIVICIVIIILLIGVAGFMYYNNMQIITNSGAEVEELKEQINQLKQENEKLKDEINAQKQTNNKIEIQESDSSKIAIEKDSTEIEESGNSTGNMQTFKFSTPLEETGVVEIKAEKAVQASGFAGASGHIFYLKNGELFYYNGPETDTQLATGIIDIKKQGEDIIAVKGNNAKIIKQNKYIEYK